MFDRNAMLEAHVQFELQRVNSDQLKSTIDDEIAALFAWFDQVKLGKVVRANEVSAWIKRNVVDQPIPGEAIDFIKEAVIIACEFLQEEKTRVDEILPRPLFDQAAETIIGLKTLRHEIIHQVVASSAYSMLIAHVLYHGIKGYVLTENAFAKNVPGVSSVVRFGQYALNSAAPKLEKSIDRQLIGFINGNIKETIADSEKFLDSALDDELMRKLADEVWSANAASELASVAGHLDTGTLQAMVDAGHAFWLHYRKTQVFHELVEGVVHGFFRRYGRKTVRAFLAEAGITQAMVAQEVHTFAVPAMETALASGYWEQRLRQRLAGFYTTYDPAGAQEDGPA